MATFTNQATLTYNGQTTTSNVTVGELVETLTAAKTAVVPTYDPDGRVTYVISLVNSGAAPLPRGAYEGVNRAIINMR